MTGGVVERQTSAMPSSTSTGAGAGRHREGTTAQCGLRLDREDPGDGAGVVGEVQARPGADLAHDPGEFVEQRVAVGGDAAGSAFAVMRR